MPPTDLRALYTGRRGRVQFVDVPPLDYLVLAGTGEPGGPGFTDAARTLSAVAGAAHRAVRMRQGTAPKVMPVEALWWTEEPAPSDVLAAVALGMAGAGSDHPGWHWQALITLPDAVDEDALAAAIERARVRSLPGVDRISVERWVEGPAAQTLHVGPQGEQDHALGALHGAIAAAGGRPCGRHHEIYLSDRRRTAAERLRTLLRQPVDPATLADSSPRAVKGDPGRPNRRAAGS